MYDSILSLEFRTLFAHLVSLLVTHCISDDSFSVNLDSLLIQLRLQITPKWYEFGEAAGIEKEVLDKFAKQCSPEECIVEMFDYWLRSGDKPTWRDVVKILKTIHLPHLAFDIEGVYTTGNHTLVIKCIVVTKHDQVLINL